MCGWARYHHTTVSCMQEGLSIKPRVVDPHRCVLHVDVNQQSASALMKLNQNGGYVRMSTTKKNAARTMESVVL